MKSPITTARFFGKPDCTAALQGEELSAKPMPFQVVREVILTESAYRRFQRAPLADTPFIDARTKPTGYDRQAGCLRCLLVTTRKRLDGILVGSDDCAHAEYAAYVRDKTALDLEGMSRDNLDLKARER